MQAHVTKNQESPEQVGKLISLETWAKTIGRTRYSLWRWRRDGVIKTVNCFGKIYITRDEIERFEQQALAGDFHRDLPAPARKKDEVAL